MGRKIVYYFNLAGLALLRAYSVIWQHIVFIMSSSCARHFHITLAWDPQNHQVGCYPTGAQKR